MPKKDFVLKITVHMSRKLFLILTAVTWIWTIFATFYFSYVAMTGQNPIIDYTLGLPAAITYFFSLTGMGLWGFIFSGIIIWFVLLIIGALIVKYRE